ncbi:hypothetical protein KsCSTR_38170 [Candidatus Kuenenia stuttgartiensis]|uniref:Uncharacterized protein n=1 Tax=Kuenenia stuttgartiensis TaxID=174633 RepID=Q1Q606_KUEST|nr:hypothetical protein KsCSTR_38170 [Candidatus Kuenenia stuttgartiensis]CAJ73006.1 unknown protein [Candidatus Kuenenia stuttgartiensis]
MKLEILICSATGVSRTKKSSVIRNRVYSKQCDEPRRTTLLEFFKILNCYKKSDFRNVGAKHLPALYF